MSNTVFKLKNRQNGNQLEKFLLEIRDKIPSDMNLVTRNSKPVPVHRIAAASSSMFIFDHVKAQPAHLYGPSISVTVESVPYSTLVKVVEFMYEGEISFPTSRMASTFKSALHALRFADVEIVHPSSGPSQSIVQSFANGPVKQIGQVQISKVSAPMAPPLAPPPQFNGAMKNPQAIANRRHSIAVHGQDQPKRLCVDTNQFKFPAGLQVKAVAQKPVQPVKSAPLTKVQQARNQPSANVVATVQKVPQPNRAQTPKSDFKLASSMTVTRVPPNRAQSPMTNISAAVGSVPVEKGPQQSIVQVATQLAEKLCDGNGVYDGAQDETMSEKSHDNGDIQSTDETSHDNEDFNNNGIGNVDRNDDTKSQMGDHIDENEQNKENIHPNIYENVATDEFLNGFLQDMKAELYDDVDDQIKSFDF